MSRFEIKSVLIKYHFRNFHNIKADYRMSLKKFIDIDILINDHDNF